MSIGSISTESEEGKKTCGDRDTAVVGSATVAGATAFEAHGMLGGEGADIGEVGRCEGLQTGGGTEVFSLVTIFGVKGSCNGIATYLTILFCFRCGNNFGVWR